MGEPEKTRNVGIAMAVGTTPLAIVSLWIAAILIQVRAHPPGYGGGGDAIMMAMVTVVSYSFAFVVLLPCIAYLVYRLIRMPATVSAKQRLHLKIAIGVLVLPPALIYSTPFIAMALAS